MNKAQYTSTSVAGGNNGKYPLSTQTLAFIQSQIELLQALAHIGGARYILKEPENGNIGIVVIDGEVLPLAAEPQTGVAIKISEEKIDIIADGNVYAGARIVRSAKYVANYSENVENLYRIEDFRNFATNKDLYTKLINLENGLGYRLYVSMGPYSISAIDSCLSNMRLHCHDGSSILNGATEYTINVYRNGRKCTQEQILMDMRRYKREYDFDTRKWSEWTAVTQNLNIEVKVSRNSEVMVRHSVLPEGAKLILLRKKRRGRKRRSGGENTVNSKYKGVVKERRPKNAYVHYKEIVLSTGKAGEWYSPYCVSCAQDAADMIGRHLVPLFGLCDSLYTWRNNGKHSGCYKVTGTSKWWCIGARVEGSSAEAYVKIGLQLIVEDQETGICERGEMARLKYRRWSHTESVGSSVNRVGFSVE